MLKKANKTAAPFDYIKQEIVKEYHGDHALYQIQTNRHKALIEFRYDPNAFPNEMAILKYNQRPNIKEKAGLYHLPATANHYSFKISSAYAMQKSADKAKDFSAQATELVTMKLIPAIIEDICHFPFMDEPAVIHLYPAEKNSDYFQWMKEVIAQAGLPITLPKIQTGGKKDIDGFALQLR